MRLKSVLITVFASAALVGCGGNADSAAGGAETAEPLPVIQPAQGAVWADTITKTDKGYVMGNPDAPIKLVEFASLTCGACANFSATAFEDIRDTYVNSGRVSFELRNFLRDPIDLTAAMLTRCGTDQSYFPRTKQVFDFQRDMLTAAQQLDPSIGDLPAEQRFTAIAEAVGLLDFFAQRGLPRTQAEACLGDIDNATALTEKTQADSEEFDINGTPTFLVNGQKSNAVSWAELEQQLQRMGAR